MRVLCFGRFYDDIPGGMQRHIELLFASLAGQVEFVHLVPSRDMNKARFELNGFPVIRTRSLNLDGSLAISPGLIAEAWRLHRRYRFDLVHLHFPDPMSHLASMVLPAAIPRVITWHADIIRHQTLLRFYRSLMRRSLNGATAIIIPTPAHIQSSAELARLSDRSRFRLIPFGYKLANFMTPHPLVERIRRQYPGQLIFALGRHVYYKGFDVLIKAMRLVEPTARLLIGGIGPLTEQWKALAQSQGVADRVHFLGLLDDRDLPAYYQACDVFCLPAVSQAEAFGAVQVEAMACGKPVVSTRLNNGVDYVNRHGVSGLTVPVGDVAALADALSRLLADARLREVLGVQARERVLAEFSLEAMGQKTLALYREVLAH